MPKNLFKVLLALIILTGVLLRGWNWSFIEVLDFEPDGWQKVRLAKQVASGRLEPEIWHHPQFLALSGGALLYAVKRVLPGNVRSPQVLLLYMITLSVLAMLLVVPMAKAALSAESRVLTALSFFAVLPPVVIGSLYIKEDIPLMFWSGCSLVLMLKFLSTGRSACLAAAAFTIGIAAGTKFPGVLLGVPWLLTLSLAAYKSRRGAKVLPSFSVLLAPALFLAGYLFFNPFVLIEPQKALHGLLQQLSYAAKSHHDGTIIAGWDYGWIYTLKNVINEAFSPPLTFAVLVGILAALKDWRKNPAAFVLATYVLIFYFVFESSPAKPPPFYARYLHPIFAPACCLAALGMSRILEPLRFSRFSKSIAVIIFCAATAFPAVRTVRLVAAARQDTRFAAAAWINGSLPQSSRVVIENPYFSPSLDRSRFSVTYRWRIGKKDLAASPAYDFFVLSSTLFRRFHHNAPYSAKAAAAAAFYDYLFRKCSLVAYIKPADSLLTYGFHNPEIAVLDVSTCKHTVAS